MEFIALLLLAPLIWSSDPVATVLPVESSLRQPASVTETHVADTAVQIASVEGSLIFRRPEDASLSMTVLRGPASAESQRFDVIVSAP